MNTRRNYGGLDMFRICAALLVIAIHTSPLTSMSEGADFFLTRILARIAVPFFLMVTGQFVAAGFLNPSVRTTARLHKFLQKTMLLYIFCILLYLPVGIYAGHYTDMTIGLALRMVIFDGTFYHLWYFPACILGIFLVHLMSLFLSLRGMTIVSVILYIIGLFGDSYYGLAQKIPALETMYGAFFQVFSHTRNGLFLAPLFLVMGMWMAVGTNKESRRYTSPLFLAGGLTVSFAVMTGEAFTLRHFELQRHDSMYFALIPVMFFLYKYLLSLQAKPKRGLRTAASWIYILHPAFIVVVRGIAKPLQMTGILVDNSLIHYIAVALLSIVAGLFISFFSEKIIGNRAARGSYRTEEALPYEAEEYDSRYQEAPDMQETEYQSDYESQDSKKSDSTDRHTYVNEETGLLWTPVVEDDFQLDKTTELPLYPPADETASRMDEMEAETDSQIGEIEENAHENTIKWQGFPAKNYEENFRNTAAENYVPTNPSIEVLPQNVTVSENIPVTRTKTVASARYQASPEPEHIQPEEKDYIGQVLDGFDLFAETREFAPFHGQDEDMADTKREIDADDYILKIMSGKKMQGAPAVSQQPQSISLENDLDYAETEAPLSETKPSEEAELPTASACSRAWIELDAEALRQNVELFCARIPQHCRLMPAVKADAYGHGIIPIARLLDSMGVDAYSVACISEGIELRKAGIKGKILILGYTSPEDFPLLRRYRLTQTVVDYPYAKELNRFGQKLHVHIGIDTGMHRIGIRCEDLEDIAAVYQLENLVVDGLFTHLCVSDSPHPQHKSFTTSQLRAFYQVIEILKADGYPCPGLHILASYGILNLLPDRREPDWQNKRPSGSRAGLDADRLAADFVRPGIALYGVLSTTADQNVWKNALKPVLSLKAKVTSVRPLHAGESVSYGITYTAPMDMQIAAIAIGYADGLPRELSNGRGYVLINGRMAPIIGRICMDQCIVNVSRIPNVKQGDIAVVIGRSGDEEITAAEIAETCGTITHEILTGLAARLGRVVKEPVRPD